jgi:hypothetical protein
MEGEGNNNTENAEEDLFKATVVTATGSVIVCHI